MRTGPSNSANVVVEIDSCYTFRINSYIVAWSKQQCLWLFKKDDVVYDKRRRSKNSLTFSMYAVYLVSPSAPVVMNIAVAIVQFWYIFIYIHTRHVNDVWPFCLFERQQAGWCPLRHYMRESQGNASPSVSLFPVAFIFCLNPHRQKSPELLRASSLWLPLCFSPTLPCVLCAPAWRPSRLPSPSGSRRL